MIKSNVISILRTFTNEEIKNFEEFLSSPFHNKNTRVTKFFDLLKNYHPAYTDKSLSKENLYTGLFGNVKYKESYIRNLLSDLNLLAEQFLQHVHVSKNYTGEKFLIEELTHRNLTELTEKKIRIFEKEIRREKSRDEEYFMNKIFIYDAKSILRVDKSLFESFRSDEVKTKIKLMMLTVMTSSFYLIVEEQRANIKHNFGFLKQALSYVKNHFSEFNDSPLFTIYYNLWMCFLEKNDEEYYLKAKEIFKTNFSILSKADKKNIYSVMQTFCINKSDSGNIAYNKELLNILLEMLKFKILSHSDVEIINLNLYRNILILCFNLQEINIMKKFISDYLQLVSPESRSSMQSYSYTHLSFLQKDFRKALELSNKINYNDFLETTKENIYFKNDIKKLNLKCLYELNYLESALSYIDAYKHFLKNNRLIKEVMRKRNLNFLNFMNGLVKNKLKPDGFKLMKLRSRVSMSKDMLNRSWLMEKIEEIETKGNTRYI